MHARYITNPYGILFFIFYERRALWMKSNQNKNLNTWHVWVLELKKEEKMWLFSTFILSVVKENLMSCMHDIIRFHKEFNVLLIVDDK